MLSILLGWEEGHMFSLGEMQERVAGKGLNAFALANYPQAHRAEVRDGLEAAWRWLEREGLIVPNTTGGSPSRLSAEAVDLGRDPTRALVAVRNGTVDLVTRPAMSVTNLVDGIRIHSFDTVERDLARALASVEADPENSVTAACSLVESVCRSILIEMGEALPARKDIDGLMRSVQTQLGLSPGRVGQAKEISDDVRQILGGLTSVAKGVGALRTHGGDAHGRESGFARLDPKLARLSLHAASSLALFLIETWEQKQQRPLRSHETV